jgi:hypothetical protein
MSDIDITDQIPDTVLAVVKVAVARLREVADALAQGRRTDAMFAGGGRYESDAWLNATRSITTGPLADAADLLAKFRRIAIENDIDADAVLRDLGCPTEEELRPSAAATAWII